MAQQQTIARPIVYCGQALQCGKKVTMNLKPMPADSGVLFSRTDHDAKPLKADPSSIIDTTKCVALGNDSWRIQTIEHLLATFHGLGIDNILVEVDEEEIPMTDNSSQVFAQLLMEAGIVSQERPRQIRTLKNAVWVRNETDPRSYLIALPSDQLRVTYCFSSDHPATGNQIYQYVHSPEKFLREIAPARTIAFEREVEILRKQGLGLGGTLDTVVLVGEEGYKSELRFTDEIVRHKILDILGDLYTVGPFAAEIVAVRSGHRLDMELAGRLQVELE